MCASLLLRSQDAKYYAMVRGMVGISGGLVGEERYGLEGKVGISLLYFELV